MLVYDYYNRQTGTLSSGFGGKVWTHPKYGSFGTVQDVYKMYDALEGISGLILALFCIGCCIIFKVNPFKLCSCQNNGTLPKNSYFVIGSAASYAVIMSLCIITRDTSDRVYFYCEYYLIDYLVLCEDNLFKLRRYICR